MKDTFLELLSPTNIKTLDLIKAIADSEYPTSTNKLASTLHYSIRTVQRQIKLLKDKIYEFNEERDERLTLKISNKNGYSFSKQSLVNIAFLEDYIFQTDDTMIILTNLLLKKNLTKKAYCNDNNSSIHLLNSSLININKFLSSFKLRIDHTHLTIIGDETQVRRVSYLFFWRLFKSVKVSSAFAQISQMKINLAIDLLATKLSIPITDIERKEISFALNISFIRYQLGFPVVFKPEWDAYLPEKKVELLEEVIAELFKDNYIYSKDDEKFFLLCMLTRPYVYESEVVKKDLMSFTRNNSCIAKATQLCLTNFSKQITLVSEKKVEYVTLFLYRSHLSAAVFSYEGMDSNGNSLSKQQMNMTLLNKIEVFLDELFEQTKDELFLSKKYLTKRYYLLATSLTPSLLDPISEISIFIDTDLPDLYAVTVKNDLFLYFKKKYILFFLPNTYFKKPDIILTTVISNSNSANAIYIHVPLENSDLLAIDFCIKQIIKARKK